MMKFEPCTFSKTADSNVNKDEVAETLALAEIGGKEIVHVFNHDQSWTSVHGAARILEADVVKVLVRVNYEFLPELSLLKSYSELSKMPTGDFNTSKPNIVDESTFQQYELGPHALRKFHSTRLTQFMGISSTDTNHVVKIVKRGTPMDELIKLAHILETNIVWVRARATYKISGLAKMERTYEELRQVR